MAEVTKRARENQAQPSYISAMIGRLLVYALCLFFFSCGSSAGAKKTVKPRYHHSYYKKHVYFKHARVGRVHIKLFEKQGVKTVKKY